MAFPICGNPEDRNEKIGLYVSKGGQSATFEPLSDFPAFLAGSLDCLAPLNQQNQGIKSGTPEQKSDCESS